eukprot:1450509-Rhodomonas_salina.1
MKLLGNNYFCSNVLVIAIVTGFIAGCKSSQAVVCDEGFVATPVALNVTTLQSIQESYSVASLPDGRSVVFTSGNTIRNFSLSSRATFILAGSTTAGSADATGSAATFDPADG